MQEEVRNAWAVFLSRYNWHYFVTITFRNPRQPHHAQSTLNQIGKVTRSRTKGRFFFGSELHLSRTLHVHGLLESRAATPALSRWMGDQLWEDYFRLFGRSQVHEVSSEEAVTMYVSKYCVKEQGEWVMS